MKLLKTTLAVVAASAISSVALAAGDTNVEYQWAKSSSAAELTYNGQTLLAGQTVKQEIVDRHTSVFKASQGMNITAIKIPCVLNNNLYDGTDDVAQFANQVVLTNSEITMKTSADNPATITEGSSCPSNTGAAAPLATAANHQTLTLATPVDEVSYVVQAIGEYTTTPAVVGTYTGTVTITTAAES